MQLSNDWNEWKILVQEFLSSKILQDLTYVHWPQDEQEDVLLSTNDIRSDRNLTKKKGRSWCFMIGKILEGGKERREEGMVNSSPSLWCVVASFSRGRGRGEGFAYTTRRLFIGADLHRSFQRKNNAMQQQMLSAVSWPTSIRTYSLPRPWKSRPSDRPISFIPQKFHPRTWAYQM